MIISQNGIQPAQEAPPVPVSPRVVSGRGVILNLQPSSDSKLVAPPQSATPVQLKASVDKINGVLRQASLNVEFSIDQDTQRTVVKVMDTETGKVIRQIPSDETLAIAHSIDTFLQQGGLLKQRA